TPFTLHLFGRQIRSALASNKETNSKLEEALTLLTSRRALRTAPCQRRPLISSSSRISRRQQDEGARGKRSRSASSRRRLEQGALRDAAPGAFSSARQSEGSMSPVDTAEIRPFQVDIPDEALADLRRRIASARWPSKELVEDSSQGVQSKMLRELARYWESEHDWRKAEARLNALPQFTTEIDGVDIHFIHVKSTHADALPLIITNGWPGSVIELLDVVGRSPTRPSTAAT